MPRRLLIVFFLAAACCVAPTLASRLRGDDDDDGAHNDDDESSSKGGQPTGASSFVQGYVFVMLIALILFCGCACLSANGSAWEAWTPPWTRNTTTREFVGVPQEEEENERRFVLLRDSMVESGETVWICFVCAFENKPRARRCALCGASEDLARTFDERVRNIKKPRLPQPSSDDDDEAAGSSSSDAASTTSSSRVRVERVESAPQFHEAMRARAFVVGRLNGLTLRQKGAARRRVWRRKRNGDRVVWVREACITDSQSRESLGYVARYDDEENNLRWSCVNAEEEKTNNSIASSSSLRTAASSSRRIIDDQPQEAETTITTLECCGCFGGRGRTLAAALRQPLLSQEDDDLEAVAASEFREKQAWFERAVETRGRHCVIEVRRAKILADSMRRFDQVLSRLSRSPLRLRMRGEIAVDAGGVEREWFEVVAKQLFGCELGYFETRREAGYAANLDPKSSNDDCDEAVRERRRELGLLDFDHLKVFRFAGRLVAKGLREQIPLPVLLALPLLKHVLSVPLSFSDLEFVDAESFQSYAWIRDNDPRGLALDFTLDDVDLVDDGRDVPVTEANKAQYLAAVLRYRVLDSVRPQLASFLEGIDDVLDRRLLAVFDYQELQLQIGGLADIDLDDWKRHTKYVGAFAHLKDKHPVVHMFWTCLATFDQTQRARLVQFVTGVSQLPASGFKALLGDDGRYCNFTLASLPRSLGVWPRAHTCFNRLDLPLYANYDELHSYLSLSIHLEVVGFTME